MKNIALFITALFLATVSFAGTTTLDKTQRNINNAWKSNSVSGVNLDNNISMVYGGEDVSPRHELTSATSFA